MPVELGASIFVEVNRNLVSAARKFGLTTQSLSANEVLYLPKTLGVYDGQSWVYRGGESGWWTTVKILWKYGMAPIKTQRLMKATTGRFFDMYEEPVFPFKDLSQTAYDLGLAEITSSTGEQFLGQNGIVPPFTTDIIQASTRVNYAQNLDKIHGLEAMVRHFPCFSSLFKILFGPSRRCLGTGNGSHLMSILEACSLLVSTFERRNTDSICARYAWQRTVRWQSEEATGRFLTTW